MAQIIKLKTDKLMTNITPQIAEMAKTWGKSGLVNVFSKHSTCAIWITEDELLHHVDIRFFLDAMVPKFKDPEGNQKNMKYLILAFQRRFRQSLVNGRIDEECLLISKNLL